MARVIFDVGFEVGDEVGKDPSDFRSKGMQFMEPVGVDVAGVPGDIELRAEFSCRSFCEGKKTDELLV